MHKALAHLFAIASALAGYWTVFQTHDPAGVKGSVGAAALAVVGAYMHNYFATVRNETTAAASIGQGPTPKPSAADIAAITRHVLGDLGVGHQPPATATVPGAATGGNTTT